MDIKVRDKRTGKIYSNDMRGDGTGIIEIHFSTSYTQVVVQDVAETEEGTKFPIKDLILPPLGSRPNWVDLIACQDDVEGEWVNSQQQSSNE